jgi:hypothetical protein
VVVQVRALQFEVSSDFYHCRQAAIARSAREPCFPYGQETRPHGKQGYF